MNPILYAIPFFLVTMWIEGALLRRPEHRALAGYERRDTRTSLIMGVGNLVIGFAAKFAGYGMWVWLYQFRLLDLSHAWWVWVAGFFAEDLCYYVFHRVGHESRFFWAAHVNHHSSRHYNLSTALRQSWTTPFTGPIFWAPLALIGFDPAMILVLSTVSLVYQYWLHTELITRMGPFEWLFNTPSHHRVHHGRNVEYLDRNYAGILIVWDRLFGTFEPERAPVDYGLTKNIETFDPVRVAFHEWVDLARDVARARSLGEAFGRAFRAPGWSPDGSTATARELRARAMGAVAGGR
ncbi:MAG: sterol desaturase family protein [Myxococcota bacterium]